MKYDNVRDRASYGYDAGNIVDGTVVYDPKLEEFVIVDEDGLAFSSQSVLKGLEGKKVRLTMISFESIETMQKLLASTQS